MVIMRRSTVCVCTMSACVTHTEGDVINDLPYPLMMINLIILRKKWSGQNWTGQTGSAATACSTPWRSGGLLSCFGYCLAGGTTVWLGRIWWSIPGGLHGWVVHLSEADCSHDIGWIRHLSLLMWTTLVHYPSVISIVTGTLTELILHPPSHFGSSFPAVGIESQTQSPAAIDRKLALRSYADFWCWAASTRLISIRSHNSASLARRWAP